MYIYLFPFGFQYTFITLPQLGHFSDTMIQPEPVSPMSQARFLHRLSGHFIFRIIPPPFPQYICCYLPALICNKGTSLSLPVPFYHLYFIGFLPTPRFPNPPERWGLLPYPARLWRPRFSAGREIYSPYRLPAPHPVIFSRRESNSFHSFRDDALDFNRLPLFCRNTKKTSYFL